MVRDLVSGSYLIRISNASPHPLVNGTHLLSSAHGTIKVFDTENDLVFTRTSEQNRDFLLDARAELAKHLPVVTMMPGHGPGELLEPLQPGLALSDIGYPDQTEAFRRLLSCFADLRIYAENARHGSRTATAMFMAALDATQGLPLNGVLSENAERILAYLVAAPVLPSHGDLTALNIIVHDGRLTIIDCDHFARRPFFYDALTAPFMEASYDRWHLASQTNSSSLNEDVDAVFESASMGSFSQNRLIVWLSYLVLHIDTRQTFSTNRLKRPHIKLLCDTLMDPRFGLAS